MTKLILDGRFMSQPFSGVQRFAYELLGQFATMQGLNVTVAMPVDAVEPTILSQNITYVTVGKHTGTRWEQIDLPRFCKKEKLPLLCTGNTAPCRYRSYVVLHDVLWLDMKDYAPKKFWPFKSRLMIRSYIYRCKALFTVSDFSAERIRHFFPRMKRMPVAVYSSVEHIANWREKPIEGIPKVFYLSVGSVFPHKNFEFILRLAKNHPGFSFVIVGKKNESYDVFQHENKIENCFFTGYIDDDQLAWLYRHCEGFILPSLYEGFGLPPLEAIACGCRKIFLSDIPVFHEIYGDCANYFDPRGEELFFSVPPISEEQANATLQKYSWSLTAQTVLKVISETEQDEI